jgi:ABC-type dipeptide/oligopeptide/nickel transport system ATPase component
MTALLYLVFIRVHLCSSVVTNSQNLLEVRGLTVELATAQGWLRAVDGVSCEVSAGQTLGLVGESGSGKTMLSLALMGLLPPGARVSGEAWLAGEEIQDSKFKIQKEEQTQPGANAALKRGATKGESQPDSAQTAESAATKNEGGQARGSAAANLLTMKEDELRRIRGGAIAMIFQEPMTALNPVMRVGAQIAEAVELHNPRLGRREVRSRVHAALRRAAVPEPEARARQFPHQLSGGLRQRAMIAMALAGGRDGRGPRLLIADEPTTALDVTVQKQILELLRRLRNELGLALLFITHDLGVVAQIADRVAVMQSGKIVEQGAAAEVLRGAKHEYTRKLLAAAPRLKRN